MASKVNPSVPIELGGKQRNLLFDLNAMVSFEEETGINLMKASEQDKLVDGMTPKQLRAFLWACLVHEDEELTIKQVGGFLRGDNSEEIARKLNEAMSAAMPEPEGGSKDKAPLPKKTPPLPG